MSTTTTIHCRQPLRAGTVAAPGPRSVRRAVALTSAAFIAVWTLAPPPASAQLDETCTVSALNRTAPVDASGVWVLPNVPSNLGPLRVRATCVSDGVTRSGESELLQVPPEGIVQVPEILFDQPPRIPASLELASPVTTITEAGAQVQLAVTGLYPDGETADLSSADAGTDYRVSNSAVAKVDVDGLLTAHTSGAVLISAVNEGALAVLRLEVITSADSDGDGLPDDWEVAHGLDPNDPVDALIDSDSDGLVNLEELQLGTDPLAPDTDGDGLLDGAELNLHGTDPLLFDTDGDGVSDGLELQAGSDPLDPNSVHLAPILAALMVSPESFTLVFNTVFGEASRLLTVTATLIDGTTLDATAARYGTSYGSSDLGVASFGAEAGRVFAGADGTATVTATNGAFSAQTLVQVETFAPTPLSFVALPGAPNAVAIAGEHAFVACGPAGLQVVDVFDPSAPQVVGSLAVPGPAFEVTVVGEMAYVAAGAGGLAVVDVGVPTAPMLLATAPTPSPALDVAVAEGFAYVVDGTGLRVFDVTEPAAPALVGSLRLPGRSRGVAAGGGLVVVAAESAGVHVIDVSDPAAPELVGSTPTRPSGASSASSVILVERTAFVADGAARLGGLKVIDLSVPSTPVVVGASTDDLGLNEVAVEGRFVFGADYLFFNAIPIFNRAAQPPVFSAAIDFRELEPVRDDNGMGIAVADGLVYMAGYRHENRRFGLNRPGGLSIGRYFRAEEEPAEPRPPVVELVAPAAGSEVRERSFLEVVAEASDDVRVDRVELTIDGELVATVAASPYRTTVRVPAGTGSVVLGAVAYDSAGSSTSAEPVELTVLPDERPTVRLLTPIAGQRALEGRTLEVAAEATDDLRVNRVEFLVDGAVAATVSDPPYRAHVPVPPASAFAVTAVAYDDVDQSATSTATTVPVDPDEPPTAAILSPLDGAAVVEGSVIWVAVGATDDFGVTEVNLVADGVLAGSRPAPPFELPVRVPLGASALTLTAFALDDLGQVGTSAEVDLVVIADPLTAVEGTVTDAEGAGVAGAQVTCAGVSSTSGAGGAFSLTGVPTADGRIGCHAEALVAGEVLTGATEPLEPVFGGVTEVGNLVVLAELLYASGGEPSGFFTAGPLLVYDAVADRFLPWSGSFAPSGLSGLAFDGTGALWATTLNNESLDELGAGLETDRRRERRVVRRASPGFAGHGESELLQLDPDTGEVLAEVGLVTDGSGSEVAVEDLAFDPVSDRLYGVDAEPFGGGTVFRIDRTTAVATPLAGGFSLACAAIAVGVDGRLYLVGVEDDEEAEPPLLLWAIDPADGQVLLAVTLEGHVDESWLGGLYAEPGGGALIAAVDRTLYRIDLAALSVAPLGTPAGTYPGSLVSLARRPLPAPPAVTDLVGEVLDTEDAPLPGVAIATFGAEASTDAGGGFVLPGVVARTGRVRVVAESLGEIVFSEAVPPVAGGVTDLGTLRLSPRVCAEGRLVYEDLFPGDLCASGPVTGPVVLEVADENDDEWLPAGIVTPGPDGAFCADLRQGGFFRVWQEGVECACGPAGFCLGFLEPNDPSAFGRCEDAEAQCESLGDVTLFCEAICEP